MSAKNDRKKNKSIRSENLTMHNTHLNVKAILSDLTNTKSILSKMVLAFLLLIVVPVSTIGFIAAETASKNLLKSTEDSVFAATKQTTDYFDSFLGRAQNISMQVISDTVIQDFSQKTSSSTDEEFALRQVNVNSLLS